MFVCLVEIFLGVQKLFLDVVVLLDVGVEPVLDFVLGSPGEVFAYLRPLAANLTV